LTGMMPPSKERATKWAKGSARPEPRDKWAGLDSSTGAAARKPTSLQATAPREQPRSAARVPQVSDDPGKFRRRPGGPPAIKRVFLDSSCDAAARKPTSLLSTVPREQPRSAARVPQVSDDPGKYRRRPGGPPAMMFALSRSSQVRNEEPDSSDSDEEKRDWTTEQWMQSDEWQEAAQGLWETTVEEAIEECGGFAGAGQEAAEEAAAGLQQKVCRIRQGAMNIALRCDSDDAASEVAKQQLWEHFLAEDDSELQTRFGEFVSRCWEENWGEGHGVPLDHWKPVRGWEDFESDPQESPPRMFQLMRARSGRVGSGAKVRGLPVGSGGVGTKMRGLPEGSRGY
jgi:hypothetical protein